MTQPPLIDTNDWTFYGLPTREYTHCYHDYPARMIPQIAAKLLDLFGAGAQTLFDPYCGTGTSLVEGSLRGINVLGTDINPLARLIAQAKTTLFELPAVQHHLGRFLKFAQESQPNPLTELPIIEGVSRLEFWFKPAVVEQLLRLQNFINQIPDEKIKLFFWVAFSETVRESSNTRNEEFKLYRYSPEKLEKFNPAVFDLMAAKLQRNLTGLIQFQQLMAGYQPPPAVSIFDFNTVQGIPAGKIAPASVDIVLTSPPYGDSSTTVAYGQYSRLSAAWLGLKEPAQVDRKLMGGKANKALPHLPSPILMELLYQTYALDPKRALEVSAFYADLFHSISHVAPLIKPGGYACYVVGNRRVKGFTWPTDQAIQHFFAHFNWQHVETFKRFIPNKRMPLRNSPTNVAGSLDQTMTEEYIVVVQRA